MDKDIKITIKEFLDEQGIEARFISFKPAQTHVVLHEGKEAPLNPLQKLKKKKAREVDLDW